MRSDNEDKRLHPVFEFNHPVDSKIWRYMSFAKFVSLIESSKLVLARVDLLEDPYEGKAEYPSYEELRELVSKEELQDNSEADHNFVVDTIKKLNVALKKVSYVNCWHINGVESEAMWKIFSEGNEAIAITSTYQKLHDQVSEGFFIGEVTYMNYIKDFTPINNAMYPFLRKRQSFMHEQELRIFYQNLNPLIVSNGEESQINTDVETNEPAIKTLDVNLNDLIESVFISPHAPSWFKDVVHKTIKAFNYDFEVIESDLLRFPDE